MNKNDTMQIVWAFDQGNSSCPSIPARSRERWSLGDFKGQLSSYRRRYKIRELIRNHPGCHSDIGQSISLTTSIAKWNLQKYYTMTKERCIGRRLKVRMLSLSGADVDSKYQDGCSPLMLAVQCRHCRSAKRLRDKATNPKARSRKGDTPLTVRTQMDRLGITLLERGDMSSEKNHQQQTHSLMTEFSNPTSDIVQQTSGVSLDNTIVQKTSCVSLDNNVVQKTSCVSLDNNVVQKTSCVSLDNNVVQKTSCVSLDNNVVQKTSCVSLDNNVVQKTSDVSLGNTIVQKTSDVSLDNTVDFNKGHINSNISTAGGSHEPGDSLNNGSADLNEKPTQSWQLGVSKFMGEFYPRQELETWARTLGSLHMAASEDDTAVMQLLIQLGADVNGVYRDQTPMMAAVTCVAVDLLIRHGANVNAVVVTSEGETTAILHALSPQYISSVKAKVRENNVFGELGKIVRSLVQEGASLTATGAAGNTPVMAACQIAGAEAVLEFLSGAGLGEQKTNAGGESVLHLAARSNSPENVRIVTLHYCVEVDLENRMGATALMIAAMNKNRNILEHLIRLGASVNKQDNVGNTSLMYAVRSCLTDTEHIRVLLEADANPNIKNETGFCPLTLAAADLSDQVLRVFLEPRFGLEEESKERALHLLLAGHLLTPKVRSCAMILLEQNTRSYGVSPGVIHKFIADGHAELVEKLISNGTPPADVNQGDPRILGYCWPVASASPLCVALLANQPGLARRIAELWYFTQSDFKLARNPQLKDYLIRNKYMECLDLLQDLSDHTISLKVISFTAISAALGNGSQRAEHIEKLKVPEIVKNMLLFKSNKKR